MEHKKYSLFLGRWQPLHRGHLWLISQELDKGNPVLILVRDIPPNTKNPFTTEETVDMIKATFKDKDVKVMVVPDIASINYGRGVGYKVIEHLPPKDIKCISATDIRNRIEQGDETWKELVHANTAIWLENYYRKKNDS